MNKARKIKDREIPQDCFITPNHIVKKMIEMTCINENDIVLDPCKGDGAFYNQLPNCIKHWCEIKDGINFFDYHNNVDIIIGNPPFSLWDQWIKHSISLNPKKICYLFGCLNLTPNRIKRLQQKGYYITSIVFVRINGYFGHSYLTLLEKDKQPIIQIL